MKQEHGATLTELIVVLFVIILFSVVAVSNFPKMARHFALSGAAYDLAQNVRKVQDLALSGLQTDDTIGAKGYGIYINLAFDDEKYYLYVDKGDYFDKYYDGYGSDCAPGGYGQSDCVLESIDINKENQGLFIKRFENLMASSVSINFSPPNPETTITPSALETGIVLGLRSEPSYEITVWINNGGLIKVE